MIIIRGSNRLLQVDISGNTVSGCDPVSVVSIENLGII